MENAILSGGAERGKDEITFGVFADLHMDIMPDPEARLDAFLAGAKAANVDFIIQLGDFSFWTVPEAGLGPAGGKESSSGLAGSKEGGQEADLNPGGGRLNRAYEKLKHELMGRFRSAGAPSYFVLGNHDMERCSKEEAVEAHKMGGRYYTFTCKGWQCFVLDANNFRDASGETVGFSHGNFYHKDQPYIDPEQMRWLGRELGASDMPAVVFSHQELNQSAEGIKNSGELRRLFRGANAKRRRVYLCVNGHMHVDALCEQDGVYYYNVNSISNYYCGEDYRHSRYSPEVERAFPELRHTFPYTEPLYAIVTASRRGMRVKGVRGGFLPPPPAELGFHDPSVTPSIIDREVVF